LNYNIYPQDKQLSAYDSEMFYFINLSRTNPVYFAENYISPHRNDCPEAEECYMEMITLSPVGELISSDLLCYSARDHSEDIGSNGLIGHIGSDSSTLRERVERYAGWEGSIAENIYYGESEPLDVVVLFLIDEKIEDRGHRRNILSDDFRYVGISTSLHFYFGKVCVIHFAGSVYEKK